MNVSLQFSDDQLRVLNDALVQLPYWKAAPLIQSINEQIAKQRTVAQQEAAGLAAQ